MALDPHPVRARDFLRVEDRLVVSGDARAALSTYDNAPRGVRGRPGGVQFVHSSHGHGRHTL